MTISAKQKKPRREEYQKKKVQKRKSLRGQPETEYGELKKPVSFCLTQTGLALLKQKSKELGLSASELIEQVARGKVQITVSQPSSTSV